VNTGLLVCERCLDIPNPQERTIFIPPDPVPILNARLVNDFSTATDYVLTGPVGVPMFRSRAGMTAATVRGVHPRPAMASAAAMSAQLMWTATCSPAMASAAAMSAQLMWTATCSPAMASAAAMSAQLRSYTTRTAAMASTAHMAAALSASMGLIPAMASTAHMAATPKLYANCTAAMASTATMAATLSGYTTRTATMASTAHMAGVLSHTVAPLTSISVFSSATSTATTITAPANINAGDLLVLLDRAENLGVDPPTLVTPTGFTSIGNITTYLYSMQNLSYKLAVGTEGNATITGMSGDNYARKALYVFRGDVAAGTITVMSYNGEATNFEPSSQTVTASSGTYPLVVIGAYSTFNTALSPRTFSPAKDNEITPVNDFYLAYRIYNSSPANTSVGMEDEGDENMLQSCYIQMAK
jgi:hypothetical protein